ncbi:MAG: NPCBM/NEW2 domain-containing protein [Streptosporangiaceae bacterium]
MTPVSGSTSSFAVGPQTVNGRQYQEALYDVSEQNDIDCSSSTVDEDTFNLDRKYHNFRVTVGVADSAPLGDTVTFTFLLDNEQKGPSPTLPAGETLPIDINVSGVFRLTLQDYCSSANPSGNQVVGVWIDPLIS